MKNTLTRMNTLQESNSRIHEEADQIRGLEDKETEENQSEQQKEK